MSNELFLRKAVLSVGPASGGAAPTLVQLPSASTGAKYDGFRISFEIDKTSESAPNPAKISIYNLQKASRAALEGQNLVCLLSVGYVGLGDGDPLLRQIFAGDVRRVYTRRQGPDLITTIEAGDEELALRGTHVEMAFGEFTTPAQVIQALASKFKLSIGTIVPAVAGVFQHGISLSGLVSDHLDTLTAQAGLEWHVTDGELNVLDPTLPTPEPAIVLNSDTGLIGFPSKTLQGITQFTSLLNPEIKPGRAIQLTSDTITGTFRVRLCRYRGDTNGGDWSVAVEAY